MVTVKQLYDVQELDLRTSDLQKSLAEVRVKIADDSALSSARARVQHANDRAEELASQRRSSERTIAEIEERLKTVESRLYGGAVTSPKELSAAEEERSFTSGQRQEAEDKLLEVMVEIEEVEEEQRESGEDLARIEVERPAELADLHENQQRMSKELAELGRARDQIAPLVPAQVLSLYESLRKSKNGRAVATVERGMCQGCRLTLSTGELQRARSSQGVVQCNSCRRILLVV